MISVLLDGKPLFEWDGDIEEVNCMGASLAEVTEPHDALEFGKAACVRALRAGGFSTSRRNTENTEMAAITYLVLMADSTAPGKPGKFRDYLPVYDFAFDIRPGGAPNSFHVKAEATFKGREGIA